MLENAIIPPNCDFEEPNPRIPFNKWKIKIPTRLQQWPTKGLRRLSVVHPRMIKGFG